ncbi:MAG: HAMP domain-containing protein [Gemmatimonadaceae bacterium]|nr:HAMP domain-containing protein [Gemmatimonadaceae bacterium]
MIRSLRARLFLTVWPLIVGAILIVAILSTRSARGELAEFEARLNSPVAPTQLLAVADAVMRDWPTLRNADGASRLQTLAVQTGDSTALLVLDTAGVIVASSTDDVAQDDLHQQPDGSLELTRVTTSGNERRIRRLVLNGIALASASGQRLGSLYALPRGAPQPSGARMMVSGIQRSVWIAVIIASLLSALGAWWLAYPIVAQVQRLTQAARAVKANALATRVQVSSADELGELERSFNDMAQSLDETEQAKRQMISDLAHELRTPLTNVVGLLEAMRDGLRAPDAATLQSTQEEALLLKHLIDELQELALVDSGALAFEFADLDIRAELHHAADAFQANVPAPRVSTPTASVMVHVDRRRVAQVMRNLLQNAATHTSSVGTITITLTADATWASIEVSDSGRGIPADKLPHIFERFYRVDPSRDRTTGGMGLGLALSRRMVERMHGTIAAHSTEGVGTRITVRLPVAAARPRDVSSA